MKRSRRQQDDFSEEEKWYSAYLRRLRRFISKFFAGDRSLERASMAEPIWKSVLLFVPRLLYELFHFLIIEWSSSRKSQAFVYGLPALGTVALSIAMITVAAWKLETRRDRFYSSRLEYYKKQEDYQFAKSCGLKLVDLNPSLENKYKLALAIHQLNDFDSAYDLMSSLAPEEKVLKKRNITAKRKPADDGESPEGVEGIGSEPTKSTQTKNGTVSSTSDDSAGMQEQPTGMTEQVFVYTGYAPAHLWLADTAAFASEIALTPEQRKNKALLHYSAAFELERYENSPESIYSALRLSELQAQKNDLAASEQTLRVAAEKPVLTLLHLQAIARLLAILKQQEKAAEIKAIADGLEPRLFKLAASMPDLLEPWQALVDVASQAENYRAADDYIQSGLAMSKDPATRKGLLQLRAAVLMRQSIQMKNVDIESRYLEKFGYLATAITVDPTNENIYLAMLEYVDLNEQNPSEDEFLRLALGFGKSPGVAHVVLGLRDAQRNERAAALNHWKIADTQTDRSEWLCGMFTRLLLKAKSLSNDEFFQFLAICKEQYPNQPMLQLADAEALLSLKQDHAQAIPLLEDILKNNEQFRAAREAYIEALQAAGRTQDAEQESLKLKRQIAEAQKQQGRANVEKNRSGRN